MNPGDRLGAYAITGRIGAGGMGEVYRARDLKLDRDVAIKVLPEAIAGDPDRLARFDREARALAVLNHPNIASIFAIEHRAIVMELVEGTDLSELIRQGPTPLPEAMAIARQLADALEAAHDRDIVHRDLKPGNIRIRTDGVVKVVDFGLAKALSGDVDASTASDASPTLTNRATELGVILGTAAYMAPEQAKGKRVDHRADIWAFGVVLYELLTGTRPFAGDDVTDVMAAVVRADPDWTALPAGTPAIVRRLLQRCLTKDVRQRLHHIADARLDIEEVLSGAAVDPPAPDARRAPGRALGARIAVAASLLAAAASIGVAFWALSRDVAPAGPSVYDVVLPAEAPIAFTKGSPWGEGWKALAVSPRADFVIYIADRGDRTELWYRSLVDSGARALPGTDGAYQLAMDPEGSSVAFTSGNVVKVASITNASVVELGRVERAQGLTWISADQVIALGDGYLAEFARAGGRTRTTPTTLCFNPFAISPSEALCGHRSLGLLNLTDGAIRAVAESSPGGQAVPEILASSPELTSDGLLVTSAFDGGLMVAGWEPESRAVVARAPVPIAVRTESVTGARQSAVSASGTLVFAPGSHIGRGRLARRHPDRDRHPILLPFAADIIEQVDVHPDGRRIAATVRQSSGIALVILDLATERRTTWIDGYSELTEPRWNDSGTLLALGGRRNAGDPFVTLVGNPTSARPPEPLAGVSAMPSDWSDDRHLIASGAPGIGRIAVDVSPPTVERLADRGNRAVLSRDGRLFAYMLADDIIVARSGDDAVRTKIERGLDPMWLDNRTLAYRDGKTWFRVAVAPDARLAGAPTVWFSDPQFIDTAQRSHALTPDGAVVYLRSDAPNTSSFLRVIPRWTTAMRSLATAR